MASVRVPNHPVSYSTHFEPLSNSSFETVCANQYGFVKTPSFVQCGGANHDKSENFEVNLVTNTALTNLLDADFIYSISGKMIALNDGSPPTLSYSHDIVTQVGATGPNQPDFTNKTYINSLGTITHRQELVSDSDEGGICLEVIVGHTDWDSEQRCMQKFDMKYIVPGSKNLIKTHSLYQVGREVKIIGRLVDFDMERHMAIVIVEHVSVTNGHQIGKTITNGSPSGSGTTPDAKKKLTKFSGKTDKPSSLAGTSRHSPSQTTPSTGNSINQPRLIQLNNSSPVRKPNSPLAGPGKASSSKGKQKAQEASDKEEALFDDGQEEEDEDEAEFVPAVPIKRGRPRKAILADAAKRMKNF